jgi:FkbM family methyltransferase
MKIFIEPDFTSNYQKSPLHLIDIGASGGLEENWQAAQKYLKVIGFEPDKTAWEKLSFKKGGGYKFLNTGLFNKKCFVNFNVTKKQKVSSIYTPNLKLLKQFPEVDRFEIINTVQIEVDSLDNVLEEHNIKDPDFIKLDTQGSELNILEGGIKTLNSDILGLEIEVEFVKMYENQPLFSEIDTFVRNNGFYLFDIQRFYFKRKQGIALGQCKGQIAFGNTLYLVGLERFKDIISGINDPQEKKNKALKAFSICFLYGYFDYALELLMSIEDVFSHEEVQVIKVWMEKKLWMKNFIPNFKGKYKLALFFFWLWKVFQPPYNAWGTRDEKLGNL